MNNKFQYGNKGQIWSPEFIKYMTEIVSHPTYANMPDAIKEDGKIQWEAPSNREGGKYQYTYNRRLDWWKHKAQEIGIDINQNQWISKTAKTIHPTKEKPCKRCGKIMKLGYYYPTKNLIKRFQIQYGEAFNISEIESIISIIKRTYSLEGDKLFKRFPILFKTKYTEIPIPKNLTEAIMWLEHEYIPLEPSTLSPGAMSNAPDRFDGFHSFNKCCRSKADTGRHAENLKTYTSDRRVFEFWTEGNWAAADKLMGVIKIQFKDEACADGGDGPPTADHIGPLSLGFCHRPEFQLLSKSANSSKNNRMTLSDIHSLLKAEQQGKRVISWYAIDLWNELKFDIKTDEDALILSKILRDNQRIAMHILWTLFTKKKFAFLTALLELEYAKYNYKFIGLHVENFITSYNYLEKLPKSRRYIAEQIFRRIRIAFEALNKYGQKNNRHNLILHSKEIDNTIDKILEILQVPTFLLLDRQIEYTYTHSQPSSNSIFTILNTLYKNRYYTNSAKQELLNLMKMISKSLSKMRGSSRYTRDIFDLDD